MDRLRRAMNAGAADDEPLADTASGSKEMRHAVRDLRLAMEEKWGSPRDEQLRVAQILKRAAADILGKAARS